MSACPQCELDRMAGQRCLACGYERETHVQATDAEAASITVEDFWAYMPAHQYLYVPTRELWPAASVNARLPPIEDLLVSDKPLKASQWLDLHRPVEQMIWTPGKPMIITDSLVSEGEWTQRRGSNCFNLYRPPTALHGDPAKANPWLKHIETVYPDDIKHIVLWLAHRVQRPGEKINHALLLGGAQGIGKDTLLEPVKYAVGSWNFVEVSPTHLLGRFNSFVKSVIMRISEARDLGDIDRYAFYDHMKVYTAAPPDVIRCDEKNLREHAVMNICGVIITSNHKTDGVYLPADDRRHYVAWSDRSKEDFREDYWRKLYGWYAGGGIAHVAAYLAATDLIDFDPKAPPPKTAAFHDIVDANRAPEDAELADVIDTMGKPQALTLTDLIIHSVSNESLQEWLRDRRSRRQIPHRLEAAGYLPVRNDADTHDGQWRVEGKRQTIYALKVLSLRDRLAAAARLCQSSR
jgi:hypothetical protein